MNRSSLVLVALALGLVGLSGILPDPATAQDDLRNHEEIKKRIAWWRDEPRAKQYTVGVFGVDDKKPALDDKPQSGGSGYAIHIAVSEVDENAYGQGVDKLPAVLNDIREMKKIAQKQGFTPIGTDLINQTATREAVINRLADAAKTLKAGDTLLVTYAGHGGSTPDSKTHPDEEDGNDETWCLYDGHLLDDKLLECWAKFDKASRIIVVVDSCHSETSTRAPFARLSAARAALGAANFREVWEKQGALAEDLKPKPRGMAARSGPGFRSRLMLYDNAMKAYLDREEEYEKEQKQIEEKLKLSTSRAVNYRGLCPAVITLGACLDPQESLDDRVNNGFFTRALVDVWAEGKYNSDNPSKSYKDFLVAIAPIVKNRALGHGKNQDPAYNVIGADNPAFVKSLPFTK